MFKTTKSDNKVVNIYLVYEIHLCSNTQSGGFALGNFLFRAVKLNKNADLDIYKYSGYGFGFDAGESFSLSEISRCGENEIRFGADMSLSVHIDNKKKDISILVKVQQML